MLSKKDRIKLRAKNPCLHTEYINTNFRQQWLSRRAFSSKWLFSVLSILLIIVVYLVFRALWDLMGLSVFNFIRVENNDFTFVHQYTIYLVSLVSITLIVTTFLFNYFKEKGFSNIEFIVEYVGYEFIARFGFSVIIFFIAQNMIQENVKNILPYLFIIDAYIVGYLF